MNKQIIKEQLEQFGLTTAEVEVYLHLIEQGAKTPLKLSRETGIERSKIYRLLESLSEKKLIEETFSERGKKVQAAQPNNLELLIHVEEASYKKKISDKKELIPDLVEILSQLPQKTNVSFELCHYKGLDGLKQMLWNELKGKDVLIFSYKPLEPLVGSSFTSKHIDEALARNIRFKEMSNYEVTEQSNVTLYNKVANPKKIYVHKHIPENVFKIGQGMVTYNNTVAIYNWKDDEFVGIEIINKPFAESFRQIFKHFWTIAK